MLNKKAIKDVLDRAPLCNGHLIAQRGLTTEYCAMGALAKACGATDDELRQSDAGGVTIYGIYKHELAARFGIESYDQFSSLMRANDSDDSSVTRNETVKKQVDALAPEEVNKLIGEVIHTH